MHRYAAVLILAVLSLPIPTRAASPTSELPPAEDTWGSLGYDTGIDVPPLSPPAVTAPGMEPNPLLAPTDASQEPASPEDEAQDAARLQQVEKRITLLRGQIQDLKSQILTLGDDRSKGFVTTTKLLVVGKNTLGSGFAFESIEYKLDGFTVYANHDPKRLAAQGEFIVYDASVLPGNHTLDAVYTLRATGYGVFTYMKEYNFDLRNQYHFATPRGKAVEVDVEALDKGIGKNLRDRPTLKFAVH